MIQQEMIKGSLWYWHLCYNHFVVTMLYTVSLFAVLISSYASSHDVEDQVGQLGRPCNTTTAAICNTISAAECRNNVCVCKPGYKMDTDKNSCNKTSLGHTCHNDAECRMNDRAWCNSFNICDCISGFVQSKKIKNRCLQEAGIGDYCEEHHQCYQNNSMCTSGRACKCKPSHRYEGGACVSNPASSPLLALTLRHMVMFFTTSALAETHFVTACNNVFMKLFHLFINLWK